MVNLQFTPYILPLLLAFGVAFFLALTVWAKRPGTAVIPFVILMTGVCLWLAFYILELSVVDIQLKIYAAIGEYIGITIIPAAWLASASEYSGRDKWLTPRAVRLLMVEPIAVFLLLITNDWHHLFWTTITLDTSNAFAVISTGKNILFWVHAIFSYGLMLVATLFLLRAMIRYPTLYRGQIGLLLIGLVAPWISNIAYLLDFRILGPLDPTPFAFTITGLLFGWSLIRYRLLDVVPVARDTVIESMSDAMLVVDKQGRIIDVNPAAVRLTGQTNPSVLIGKLVSQILPAQKSLIQAYAQVSEARAEIRVPTATTPLDFELRISPIRNRHGDMTGRVVVLRDITEQKKASTQIQGQNDSLVEANRELAIARREAEEAVRIKSEFVATMSHELRTPLNAIIGYSDIIVGGMAGEINEDVKNFTDRVLVNANNLLSLINDILDLSKIEAGRIELQNTPISVHDLIRTVIYQTKGMAELKNLSFHDEIASDMPEIVLGDGDRIRQILINLVSNAIKFTEQGGVTIQVACADDARWSLAVSDTGIGVPLHAQEYIFDEFRQADGSTERQYGGTGLGLAIVRKLVLLMNGTIQLKSVPGTGSTFTVYLPLLSDPVPEVRELSK